MLQADGDDRFSVDQLAAIEYLSRGASQQHAAEMAGVDRRTIWRWRQNPEFNERLKVEVHEVLERGRLMRQQNWLLADQLFQHVMADETQDMRDRLYAASCAQRTLPAVLKLSEETEELSTVKMIDQARVNLAERCLQIVRSRKKHAHPCPRRSLIKSK